MNARTLALVAVLAAALLGACSSEVIEKSQAPATGAGDDADGGAGSADDGTGAAGGGGAGSATADAGARDAARTDGAADAAAKDGGHADGGGSGGGGGGGGGGGPDCVALDACCQELGSQMVSGCESIVTSGYDTSCASALSSYHQSGYCTGGTNCQELASCCPGLPSTWQQTCDYYVDLNNDSECARMIGTYQQDGYCGGGDPQACSDLQTCCDQLPQAQQPSCTYYVTQNSQTDCATIHDNYRQAGLCN